MATNDNLLAALQQIANANTTLATAAQAQQDHNAAERQAREAEQVRREAVEAEERAAREADRQLRDATEVSKWREEAAKTSAIVDFFKRLKTLKQHSVLPWREIDQFLELLAGTWRAYTPSRRKVALATWLECALLPTDGALFGFTGDDKPEIGAAWFLNMLTTFTVAPLVFFHELDELLPASRVTLGDLYPKIQRLIEFHFQSRARAQPAVAPNTIRAGIELDVAIWLDSMISFDTATFPTKAALRTVGTLPTNAQAGPRLSSICSPSATTAHSTVSLTPTRRKAEVAPKKYTMSLIGTAAAASDALWFDAAADFDDGMQDALDEAAAETEAPAAAPEAAAALAGIATTTVSLCRPDGTRQQAVAIIDCASNVSLVDASFFDSLSGSTAVATSAPLRSMRGATGDMQIESPHPAVALQVTTLAAAEASGAARSSTTMFHRVENLPADVLIGTTGMAAMGGARIAVGRDASVSVQFGDTSAAHTDASSARPPAPSPAPPPAPAGARTPAPASVFFTMPSIGIRGAAAPAFEVEVTHGPILNGCDPAAGSASIACARAQQMQVAGELAHTFAAERGVPLDRVAAQLRVDPDGTTATVLLSIPSLSDPAAHNPVTDVATPVGDTTFKYIDGFAKFEALIAGHDELLNGEPMPESAKQRLIRGVRASGVRFASKEAPPLGASFITDPSAVFHLRFRGGAAQEHVASSSWRPMERESFMQMQEVAAAWRATGLLVPVESGDARAVSVPLMVMKRDPITGAVLPQRRMAIDLRPLNQHLAPDRVAPAPRLHTVRRVVERAELVTTVDYANFYMQFPVAPADQRYFVIQTSPGRYEKLTGVPFGVSTMSGHAQRWMDARIVAGDDDKIVYLDDLIIEHRRGGSWGTVVDSFIALCVRCARYNVIINVDKLQFATAHPVVLGYKINCDSKTFQANPPKSAALADLPRPTAVKALTRWINCVAAMQHCLPGANRLLHRLRAIAVPAQRLTWSPDADEAWTDLVALLTDPQHMIAFDELAKVFVWTDASASGLSWVITQIRAGKHFIISCGGRRTEPFEANKWTPELEALALRDAFEQQPDMLLRNVGGTCWVTDSRAVALARSQRTEIKSRAVRVFIAELLAAGFGDVEIAVLPGDRNGLADAISRSWEEWQVEPLAHVSGPSATSLLSLAQAARRAELALLPPIALLSLDGGDHTNPPPPSAASSPAPPASPLLTTTVATPASPPLPPTPPLQVNGDDVVPEPEPAPVRSPTAPTTAPPSQPHNSDAQIAAVDDALAEATSAVAAERLRWAHAQAHDTSQFMRSARAAASGHHRWHKATFGRRFQVDELGRVFVGEGGKRQLVVPESMLHSVLFVIHEHLAHKKAATMVASFERFFYHPDALKVAQQIISECVACQQTDVRRPDGRIGADPRTWARFEKVSFDIFEIGNSGPTRYGLLVIDHATGVVEVTPLANHSADAVVEALESGYLSRWPCPRVWQSDNAQELIGTAMSALEVKYGITRDTIASHNPQANGIAERAIGLFKTALRRITPLGTDWTTKVSAAQWALMCSVSKTRASMSPVELATGVTPTPPLGAAAAQISAVQVAVPEAVAKQGTAAVQRFTVDATKSSLAKAAAAANQQRLQRSVAAQAAAKGKVRKPPIKWQPGAVAWLEGPPSDSPSKFNAAIKRSRVVVVLSVDEQRLRVKAADWTSRIPLKGWVAFRRLSPMLGATRPTATQADQVATSVAAQLKPKGTPGLAVVSDAGIIVDIIDTTDGREVLLAMPQAADPAAPDWQQPLLRIAAAQLPTHITRTAWQTKQQLRAPKGARRSARNQPARSDTTRRAPIIDEEEV